MYLKRKIDFCITVGLPKTVSSYITKGNFDNVTRIQKNLIADYKKDNSTLKEDFFLCTKSRVVPVEVKASNNNSKTLRTLIESRNYREIEFGVKLISGNIGFNGSIYTFPHYTAFLLSRFLEEME